MSRNRWILGGILLFLLPYVVDRWMVPLPEPIYFILTLLGAVGVLLGCVRDNGDH